MKRLAVLITLFISLIVAVSATEVYEIKSRYIPSPAKVSVALPSGYNPAEAHRWPVTYLLNGHGGDHTTWGKLVNLDSLATANRMIIVCPAGLDSWYWDAPADPSMKMESYIIRELIPWVDSHYRTRTDRMGRAISGLSMGGHGALWLAIRHQDLFGAAGSTSGGVDIRPFPGKWNIPDRLGSKAKYPERWEVYTVTNILDSLRPGSLDIIFDCGTEDFFFKVNKELDRKLTARGIDHTFRTSPGNHSGAYWRKSIPHHLRFFQKVFSRQD